MTRQRPLKLTPPLSNEELKYLGYELLKNKKAFILNNIMRTREMFRYGVPAFRYVYQAIPCLLQANSPTLPGYLREGGDARGTFGFERSGYAKIFQELFPEEDYSRAIKIHACIQSIMLMGSTGSIGHTSASDLDYWILVDQHRLSDEDLALLQQKADLITEWAEAKHRVEVHFFIMTLDDLQANRLGVLDEDSSGDVMPRLLKEEFYRTVLHVVGRMPLWWVVPSHTTDEQYGNIISQIGRIETTSFDNLDFIDLGFVEPPGPREYLGAAMWQAHKSKRDPFKAVLKMILILEQVNEDFKALQLCDEVKTAVFNASPENLPVDPYLLTIDRVLTYTGRQLPQMEELVRISVLYKLHAPWDPAKREVSGKKAKVLERLRQEWGWPRNKIKDFFSYNSWSESRKIALGQNVKNLLLDLYSRIASRLRTEYPDQVRVEDTNLTKLNARLLARYGKHDAKVDDLPSDLHTRNLPETLIIVFHGGKWVLLTGADLVKGHLYSDLRVAKVAAFLVHNGIWRTGRQLRIQTGDRPMKPRALIALLPLLEKAFPPVQIAALQSMSLLPRPVGSRVLLINMEESSHENRVITAELIYRTSLGEMFHEVLRLPQGTSEAQKSLSIAQRLFSEDMTDAGEVIVYVPMGIAQEDVKSNMEVILRHYRKKGESQPAVKQIKSKSKLDI